MRTLAWLNAVPEAPPTGKGVIKKKKAGERQTRLQEMKAKGSAADLPEVEIGGYLVDYLMEVGPVESAGMGTDRISNRELRAWQKNTGIRLTAWESRTLCRLSREYAGESQRATAHDCPPPWLAVPDEVDRNSISKGLQNALRDRMTGPKR